VAIYIKMVMAETLKNKFFMLVDSETDASGIACL
jgi:hypothetical protein